MKLYLNSYLKTLIHSALKEDIGKRDITSELFIPDNKKVEAIIIAKEKLILCGLDIARLVFKIKDKSLKFKSFFKEGDSVNKNKVIASVYGRAHSILSAERVALNFLSLMSGIATKTRKFVEIVKPYNVKIMDTRKTIPGLRAIQKYAVKVGGGFNHRFRLDEMVLIKDNHLKIVDLKNIRNILNSKRPFMNKKIKTEIEVKNLREFKHALELRPDIIMLDNMNLLQIKKAVKMRDNLPIKLEASGGINFKNIKKIASLGIDMISIGELTHSTEYVDISLEIV